MVSKLGGPDATYLISNQFTGDYVATLTTDLLGRVKRLPLKPSATSALLPMFEAVSNGLHAIDDRFGDKAKDSGRIDIEVLRADLDKPGSPVTGFVILDNGIGLNEENYASFLKPDSQHKINRGGKGVGRLGWLKVFSDINVNSSYLDGSALARRVFDFQLRDQDQIVFDGAKPAALDGPGTKVSLRTFESVFGSKCPVQPVVLRQRVIGHFMQVLAAEIAPAIYLVDGSERTDLRAAFKDMVRDSREEPVSVDLGEPEPVILTLRHILASKAIRPDANRKNYNWLFLSANQRAVDERPIDDAIGLKALREEQVYVGCVYGPYLDEHVNQERTAFTFSAEENTSIRRALAGSILAYLSSYVDEVRAKKRSTADRVVEDYPQFLYLKGEMESFVEKLPPGATSREAVFSAMCLDRYRKVAQFSRLETELLKAPAYSVEVAEQMARYQGFVEKQQEGVLAEYVLVRKSIIDILEKYMGFREEKDSNYLEDAIHKLIVPMRTDSARLAITDHQLWLLDDRLAFFAYFASDKQLRTYTNNPSADRPDIAFFYDNCFAWKETDAGNTVVLVEFKRPGRDDYDGEENPVRQLISYIRQIQGSTSLRDSKGRTFSPGLKSAAFHCYVVADITDSLRDATGGYSFHDTPDKLGLVGYLRQPEAFVEILSYEKLLMDAKRRNAIFFDKVGITSVDPADFAATQTLDAEPDDAHAEEDETEFISS